MFASEDSHHVAHASLRAGEAASCRPCTEKVKLTQEVNPLVASEAGSFVTGLQGCGRYYEVTRFRSDCRARS